MRLRPSDLKRIGAQIPHVYIYTGPNGVGFLWSRMDGIRGTDGTKGTDGLELFSYVGEASKATEAKRCFCVWYNRQGL